MTVSESLTLRQVWRDAAWIDRQVSKGRLSPLFKEYLPAMVEVMERVYPGMWDFDISVFKINSSYTATNLYGYHYNHVIKKLEICLQPVIRMPDGEIKNSQGLSRPMKGLVIRIPFITKSHHSGLNIDMGAHRFKYGHPSDGLVLNKLEGLRLELSPIEISKGYLHSHLVRRSTFGSRLEGKVFRFNSFCLGSEETPAMLSSLSSSFSKERFTILMLHLKVVAYWESLEGGPHIKMANLTIGESDNRPNLGIGTINSFAKKIIDANKQQKTNYRLRWRCISGNYSIVPDDTFENYLKMGRTIPELIAIGFSKALVTRDALDRDILVITVAEAGQAQCPIPDEEFYFRGQRIKLTITPTEIKEKVWPSQWYIATAVKNEIRQIIESNANDPVRSHAIEWLNRN